MEYTIKNEKLQVTVRSLGGSLRSIRDSEGTEFLWQGDPAYWKDQAPNLFPYIARMTEGKYVLDGKEYHMDIHGFVKDSELSAAAQDEGSIRLTMTDDAKTLEQYPYHFRYEVGYRLEGSRLVVAFTVENKDEKTMYFGIGGHPGFRVPIEDGLKFEDYCLQFSGGKTHSAEADGERTRTHSAETAGEKTHSAETDGGEADASGESVPADAAESASVPKRVIFTEKCFVTGERRPYSLQGGDTIPLRHDLFDEDAIILTDMPRTVTLRSDAGRKAVRVACPQMDYLGFWHMPHMDAPYVCIEPWSSLPSRDGIVEDLSAQPGLISLAPGAVYENQWEIEIVNE